MNDYSIDYGAWKISNSKKLEQVQNINFAYYNNYGVKNCLQLNFDFLDTEKTFKISSFKDIFKKHAEICFYYSSQKDVVLNNYVSQEDLTKINHRIFTYLPVLKKSINSFQLFNTDLYIFKSNKENNSTISSFRDLLLLIKVNFENTSLLSVSLFDLCLFYNFFDDFKKANNELFLLIKQ